MTKSKDPQTLDSVNLAVYPQRALGSKGERTRQRIIEVTETLLRTTYLRDLRVAEIARQAGISSATFYVYFKTISDVIFAALAEIPQSTPEILSLLEEDWTEANAMSKATALVETYANFWESHSSLFRVRNLVAEEDHERVRQSREASTHQLVMALTRLITLRQQALKRVAHENADAGMEPELNPRALAGVLIAMVERISTVINSFFDSAREPAPVFTRNDMIQAAASLFAHALALPKTAVSAQKVLKPERKARSVRDVMGRDVMGSS